MFEFFVDSAGGALEDMSSRRGRGGGRTVRESRYDVVGQCRDAIAIARLGTSSTDGGEDIVSRLRCHVVYVQVTEILI